jgi:hypothetical protein
VTDTLWKRLAREGCFNYSPGSYVFALTIYFGARIYIYIYIYIYQLARFKILSNGCVYILYSRVLITHAGLWFKTPRFYAIT